MEYGTFINFDFAATHVPQLSMIGVRRGVLLKNPKTQNGYRVVFKRSCPVKSVAYNFDTKLIAVSWR